MKWFWTFVFISASVLAQTPTLTFTAPSGGESFVNGTPIQITWTSSNLAENLVLEFSFDNQETWQPIALDVPNNGQYTWNAPDITSDDVYLRAYGFSSRQFLDTTQTTFSLQGAGSKPIRVEAEDVSRDSGYELESRQSASNDQVIAIKDQAYNGSLTYNFDLTAGTYDVYFRYVDETDGVSQAEFLLDGNVRSNWSWNEASIQDIYVRRRVARLALTPGNDLTFNIAKGGSEPGRVDYIEFVEVDVPTIQLLAPNGGEKLHSGRTFDITWRAENHSGLINIELSRDNGGSWESIASGIANTGSYGWEVTGPATQQAGVRISSASDPSIYDMSDSAFEIVNTRFKLLKPNGGEVWEIGEQRSITWYTIDYGERLNIEISRDLMQTWDVIAEDVFDDGEYTWTVTGPGSEECIIRVISPDGVYHNRSDTTFTILPERNLTLEYPNGGEAFIAGQTETIRWSSQLFSGTVDIEISRDNKSSWQTLAEGLADDGEFNWTVTGPATETALIRIVSMDETLADTSDTAFEIVEPQLTVITPNGGETWITGETETVRWNSANINSTIKIELSRDNQANWQTLAAGLQNSGQFSWQVSSPAAEHAFFRVSSTDGSAADISDAAFQIVSPSLTVLEPNGGESWEIGSMQNIRWKSAHLGDSIVVSLSRDNGQSWEQLGALALGDSSLTWSVAAPASNQCRVRIEHAASGLSDVSDASFTIFEPLQPSLTLLTPNGGETWATGSEQTIRWQSNDLDGDVEIALSRDNGQSWQMLGTPPVTDSTLTWMVETPVSNQCRVKMKHSGSGLADTSDTVFEIFQPLQPELTLVTPDSGEAWAIDSEQSIRWTSNDLDGNVEIKLSRDNGQSWQDVGSAAIGDSTLTWRVTGPASNQCLIEIRHTDSGLADTSNVVFEIFEPSQPALTLLAPNGGEKWLIGEEKSIHWRSMDLSGGAILSLSRDGGDTWEELLTPSVTDSSLNWVVTGPASDSCLVQIQHIGSGLADTSTAVFAIAEPLQPGLTLLSPNGHELFYFNSQQRITWRAVDLTGMVILELSTDAGDNWQWLGQTAATDSSFTFTVPEQATDSALVRVRSNAPQLADTSDTFFSIQRQPDLILISPNGGETAWIGEPLQVIWASTNTSGLVRIELSRDGGANWSPLATAAPDTGGFTWMVTGDTGSDCLLRVMDAADGAPADSSDAPFEIRHRSQLLLTFPNGGETFLINDIVTLLWQAEFVHDSLRLELQREPNGPWEVLTTLAPDARSYDWQISPPESQSARMRISTRGGSAADTSNAAFAVVFATGVETAAAPTDYSLEQNYPNPFNPSTTIQYSLPESGQVTLQIFNSRGQRVRRLVQTQQAAGRYSVQWNGLDDHGNVMPSGMYFFKLRAGDFTQTKRMIFMQ